MDPLSITASVIAILGLAGTAVRTVSTVAKLVPSCACQLEDLLLEVSDLELVLSQIQQLRPSPSLSARARPLLNYFLHEAADTLEALNMLLQQVATSSPSGEKQVKSAKWLLKRGRIEALLGKVRRCKQNLLDILHIYHAYGQRTLLHSIS